MQHTSISPLYETEHHMPSNMRGRKLSSTGGNRSWSEEEETYLLQTRMQKMPYKHIAAHLKKTELACRLHYHQLSHGSHRRKRTASVSSQSSSGLSPQVQQYSLPSADGVDEYAVSRQCSPISYGQQTPPLHHPTAGSSPAARTSPHHKILLPKPAPLTPRTSPEASPARLRINTQDIHPMHAAHHVQHQQVGSNVDADRLRAIYEARRASFWASIAAEYGSDVSPAQLEAIWRSHGAPIGARPPTPDPSPDGSISQYPAYPQLKPSPFPAFSPMYNNSAVSAPERYTLPTPQLGRVSRSSTWSNGSNSNVPIAALLTEDKNPREQ